MRMEWEQDLCKKERPSSIVITTALHLQHALYHNMGGEVNER